MDNIHLLICYLPSLFCIESLSIPAGFHLLWELVCLPQCDGCKLLGESIGSYPILQCFRAIVMLEAHGSQLLLPAFQLHEFFIDLSNIFYSNYHMSLLTRFHLKLWIGPGSSPRFCSLMKTSGFIRSYLMERNAADEFCVPI